MFQHTAARRRLKVSMAERKCVRCFNTQPPEGGCAQALKISQYCAVSTHSRPKAAADRRDYGDSKKWFQHTAARRRLAV